MSTLLVHRVDGFGLCATCLRFSPLHQSRRAVKVVELHVAQSYRLFGNPFEENLIVRGYDEGGEVLEGL